MMGKIIITYDGVTENDAVYLVGQVINEGRISRNDTTYCCASRFGVNGKAVMVLADKTKNGTDTFRVYRGVTE